MNELKTRPSEGPFFIAKNFSKIFKNACILDPFDIYY
jgi:hypothetical protein